MMTDERLAEIRRHEAALKRRARAASKAAKDPELRDAAYRLVLEHLRRHARTKRGTGHDGE